MITSAESQMRAQVIRQELEAAFAIQFADTQETQCSLTEVTARKQSVTSSIYVSFVERRRKYCA